MERIVALGTHQGARETKSIESCDLMLLALYHPRYFALTLADFAYRTGQAAPVQPAVIGTLPEAPTFWWITASSLEQKLRIPVTL